ncbi:sensor histidine kinase [Modestobacter sp. I12A-02628]|uniref:Sensor histidine kinase n=1 Tax=Goekera deserti TaxID=2497753 RepID=A0A7K3WAR5_9ACTN|nr:sensor histidine kinase [Goekera deserti]NDI49708.1 sensor histidine kinase [Goekera deserti]NEL53099.1 sensor histidine kinase [Goekera deserti]
MAAVPTVSRWWSSRTDPQRIELYTRSSFYSFAWGMPLLALLVLAATGPSSVVDVVPYLGCVAVTAVLCWVLTRAGLATRESGARVDARLVTGACAAALLTSGVALATLRFEPRGDSQALLWATVLAPLSVLCVLATVWETRRLVLAAVPVGVLAGTAVLLLGDPAPQALLQGVVLGVTAMFLAASFRFTVWLLDVVLEMERSRGVQLRLAVAEERLRFARDLHDVMGRNLSAIAVKGQLAEQLVRRGREGAAEEVADISRIAEESLREVREVVRGYRSTDLTSELTGARSVLRAAGVSCTVTGEDVGGTLPDEAQTALAWVVREAVTNVLRHSRATTCTIVLQREAGEAELTVRNDGAPEGAPATHGNGLTGLAERLGSRDRLRTSAGGGWYALTARVSA